jgi:hypothetical protein
MELETTQEATLLEYLGAFDGLIGDRRTRVTFRETVKGIISAGSLVCQRIAATSAVLSVAKEGGQRVSRLVTGESKKRSQINAETLTAALSERGTAHLWNVSSTLRQLVLEFRVEKLKDLRLIQRLLHDGLVPVRVKCEDRSVS